MTDNLNLLLSNGMSLDKVERLMADGIPMSEIAVAAQAILDRGETLTDTEPDPAVDSTPDPTGKKAKRLSIDIVSTALQELGVSLRFNQLLKEAEIKGLPECYSTENAVNVLPVYLGDYLRECGYKGITPQAIDGYLACIADMNRFNPVREYLEAGTWDGKDRFEEVYRILGVTTYRYKTYILKWFIQCVALGLNDEEKPVGADGVLVLQGEQGIAKTSFFRIMTPFPRWFVEGAVIDMGNKDSIIHALSGWVTELGELDSTLKREQMSLKAFITKPEDRIRVPYAHNATRSPRRTSFCGTVNPADYLRDETGSRRFWTIPITNIDKRALFALDADWVHQLWLETYEVYKANPAGFRLEDNERKELQEANREFETPLPFELEIMELLDFTLPVNEWEWWRAAEVAERLPGKGDAVRVGRALKKIAGISTLSTRIIHGVMEYKLPVIHYFPRVVKMGGEGGVRVDCR